MEIPNSKQKLLKKYFSEKTLEIEARFGFFENKQFKPQINKDQYNAVFAFFSGKKEFYTQYYVEQTIKFNNENIKKITNTDENGSFVTFMKKDKIVNIDVPEYNLRFGISKETFLNDVTGYTPDDKKTKKRTRNTFTSEKASIKVDLSCSTDASGEISYDVELELLHEFNPDYSVFLNNVNLLQCILQNTDFPISNLEIKKTLSIMPLKGKKFPGIQPVALKNGMLTRGTAYAVTKKLDGTRCVLVVSKGRMFLCFKNKTMSKYPFISVDPRFEGCIFDGEYFRGSFYIFDCICEGKALEQRLAFIKDFIQHAKPSKHPDQETVLTLKEYFMTKDVFKTLNEMSNDIDEEIYDGLVVIKTDTDYKNCEPLKWKKLITFDFSIDHKQDKTYSLSYQTESGLEEFGEIILDFNIKPKEIVECFYTDNKWNILRNRPDKLVPNFKTTVLDNWEAARDPFCPVQKYLPDNEYNLRRFVNYVKRVVLDQICKNCNSLLDLNFEKGNDIIKYIDVNVKNICGLSTFPDEARAKRDYFMNKSIYKNFNVEVITDKTEIGGVYYDTVVSNKYEKIQCKQFVIFGEAPQNIKEKVIFRAEYLYYYDYWTKHDNSLSRYEMDCLKNKSVTVISTK